MNGVLGHHSALVKLYCSGDKWGWWDEFFMNHAPGAESIARPVDQQSSALLLNHFLSTTLLEQSLEYQYRESIEQGQCLLRRKSMDICRRICYQKHLFISRTGQPSHCGNWPPIQSTSWDYRGVIWSVREFYARLALVSAFSCLTVWYDLTQERFGYGNLLNEWMNK